MPIPFSFSERNIKFMVQLFKEYESDAAIGKQAVSQLENVKRLVSQIPWGHNILLMQRIKEKDIRIWYIEQTIQNGWSRDILGLMIKSAVHLRQGNAVTNFNLTLPDTSTGLLTTLVVWNRKSNWKFLKGWFNLKKKSQILPHSAVIIDFLFLTRRPLAPICTAWEHLVFPAWIKIKGALRRMLAAGGSMQVLRVTFEKPHQ